MRKREALELWEGLSASPLCPSAVPYKHSGSTFSEDGVRVTGSRRFVESVMFRLRELLEFEAIETRLSVSLQEVQDRDSGRLTGAWSFYVQVHERGGQGKIAEAILRGRGK